MTQSVNPDAGRSLRVGVIGVGVMGSNHARVFAGLPGAELVAVAAHGARFTRAFAATPVCSPSRMTWMTGCLPATHRVEDWLLPEDSFGPKSRDWLDGLLTWPEVLKARGYTTAMCGKWHMGPTPHLRPSLRAPRRSR